MTLGAFTVTAIPPIVATVGIIVGTAAGGEVIVVGPGTGTGATKGELMMEAIISPIFEAPACAPARGGGVGEGELLFVAGGLFTPDPSPELPFPLLTLFPPPPWSLLLLLLLLSAPGFPLLLSLLLLSLGLDVDTGGCPGDSSVV